MFISKSDVGNIRLGQKLFDELSVEGGNVYISVIDGLYRLKGRFRINLKKINTIQRPIYIFKQI